MNPNTRRAIGWQMCLRRLFFVTLCSLFSACPAPDPCSTTCRHPQGWLSGRALLTLSPPPPYRIAHLRLAGGGESEDMEDDFGFEKVTSLDPPHKKKPPKEVKPRKKRALKDIKTSTIQEEDNHQNLADLFESSDDTESESFELSTLANETQALLNSEFAGENMNSKDGHGEKKVLGTDVLMEHTPMEMDMVPEKSRTWKNATVGGLMPTPIVALRGHKGVTLEHFRMERIAFDEDGEPLPKHTYRWRDTLVRVELDARGRKQRLLDVVRGEEVHRYAARTPVFLRRHPDAALEDFPLERRPTHMMGVYRWRDREVRVVVDEKGKIDRLVDTEDGSNIFIFDEEDTQAGLLQHEMLDPKLFKLDRHAATLRLARLAERAAVEDSGPPFGPTQVVWPQEVDGEVEHGCTLIWLHGMGGSADLSLQVAERLDMKWCKFIFLGAPLQPVSLLNGSVTTSWFDVDALDEKEASEDEAALERSVEYVCAVIQEEIECAVPPRKIALAGVGQGAAVAVSAALRTFRWTDKVGDKGIVQESMQKIAAAACLSGWLPKSCRRVRPAWRGELRPTYWKGVKVGKRGGVELMVAHGKLDEVVPYKLGRRLFKAALKMGFAASEMHKYEMGHGICGREFIDLQIFLHRILPSPVLSMQQMLGMPRVPWTLSQLAPMDLLEPAKAPPPRDAGAMERLRQLQKS